jgi:hypothetical protein
MRRVIMSQMLRGPLTVMGRVLLCTIFLLAAVANKILHFSDVAKIMESVGVSTDPCLVADDDQEAADEQKDDGRGFSTRFQTGASHEQRPLSALPPA